MPCFNGPWVSLRSTHGYTSDHPHTGMHNAMGVMQPTSGLGIWWGWDGATGAPLALPAVNVILPFRAMARVGECKEGGPDGSPSEVARET